MNLDNEFPLAGGHDLDGVDMRIDDSPLPFAIAAHLVVPVDVPTFPSICLNDAGCMATRTLSVSRLLKRA